MDNLLPLVFIAGLFIGAFIASVFKYLLNEDAMDYKCISKEYSKAAKKAFHSPYGVLSDSPIKFTPIGNHQPDTSMHVMD